MIHIISLNTDSSNTDPTYSLKIESENGKIYFTITDSDREVSILLSEMKAVLSAIEVLNG